MVGILPYGPVDCLRPTLSTHGWMGIQLLEQQLEWQQERHQFFSEATMAKILEHEEYLELSNGVMPDTKLLPRLEAHQLPP